MNGITLIGGAPRKTIAILSMKNDTDHTGLEDLEKASGREMGRTRERAAAH